MATSQVLVQIFVIFASLGGYGLFARSYFDNDPDALRRLVSTGTGFNVLAAVVLLAVSLLLGSLIQTWTKFPASWLPAVVAIALTTVIQSNYLSLIQARGEPMRYMAIQILAAAGNLGLSVFLVLAWKMDWHGRMWAVLIAQSVVGIVCAHRLAFRLDLLRPIFSHESYRTLMAFGIPLIPHAIGGWFMTMGARIYLNNIASVGDTGLYGLAFNLTSPLALVVGSVNNAFMPALFRQLSNPACDRMRLCRILVAAAIALPVFSLACAIAVRWVLPLIVHKEFYGASSYVGWMTLTYSVQGIYVIFGNFVVFSKRTALMTWRADFLGGAVLLVACPLLIRLNGPIGAAQASLLAVAASAIGCITAARKAFPMPWGAAFRSLFSR